MTRRHGREPQAAEAGKCVAESQAAKTSVNRALEITFRPSGYSGLDDISTSFFFDRYVVNSGSPRVDTGFFLEIYRESTQDDMLQASTNAIGMFLSSSQSRNRVGVERAFQKYASALRLTHSALNNPTNLNFKLVLATIILLALFEVLLLAPIRV